MVLFFDFTIDTLGSNSAATQGPSVVELITFAALSWSVIVLTVLLLAMWWCLTKGKQSINTLHCIRVI